MTPLRINACEQNTVTLQPVRELLGTMINSRMYTYLCKKNSSCPSEHLNPDTELFPHRVCLHMDICLVSLKVRMGTASLSFSFTKKC